MEINNLNELIIKSLEEYDESLLKYDEYFNEDIYDVKFNHNIYEIKFINNNNNNIYKSNFEILGIFDNATNIWIWGWAIYINNDIINIAKELLNYGLKLEPALYSSVEYSFIKSLLVNSRILIETDIELINNLSIIYYLIKNKCSFIFPNRYYLNDVNYITYYYIIK